MQTFLPYRDFSKSAMVLDDKRLGKQRVECYQILRTLLGVSKGWQNHPAVRMWRGYEHVLYQYTRHVCQEWKRRGFKDTVEDKVNQLYLERKGLPPKRFQYPPWLGRPTFHKSHRSNLLRKAPEHYRKYWPTLADDLPYEWPA